MAARFASVVSVAVVQAIIVVVLAAVDDSSVEVDRLLGLGQLLVLIRREELVVKLGDEVVGQQTVSGVADVNDVISIAPLIDDGLWVERFGFRYFWLLLIFYFFICKSIPTNVPRNKS